MKKKLLSVLFIALLLTLILGTVTASAFEAYNTYTYSIDGQPLLSPAAYSASMSIDSTQMGLINNFGNITLSKSASDIVTDELGNVYIADSGNNRIVVLDRYYRVKFCISEFINSQGNPDALLGPQGVFITDEAIWVCDTDKNRILNCLYPCLILAGIFIL